MLQKIIILSRYSNNLIRYFSTTTLNNINTNVNNEKKISKHEVKKKKKQEINKLRQEAGITLKVSILSQSEQANQLKHKSKATRDNNKLLFQGKATRFQLGNGHEAITSEALLELVKSTAPYIFITKTTNNIITNDNEEEEFINDNYKNDKKFLALLNCNNNDDNDNSENNINSFAINYDLKNTLLSQLSVGPMGWMDILTGPVVEALPPTSTPTEEQRVDYFALCIASHFATVATFVPTDVDSKIRGNCWLDPSKTVLIAQFEVLLNAMKWNVNRVSKRNLIIKNVTLPISGHDGEFLGVLAGSLGAFLRHDMPDYVYKVCKLLDNELEREVEAFKYMRLSQSSVENDTELIKLSAILCHNAGDIDQGLSYWENDSNKYKEYYNKYYKLSHERYERYNGEFSIAKTLYSEIISSEGHRNYPLREAKCLRKNFELNLPFAPWLESWGRLIATHYSLTDDDRIQVVKQLIRGCDSTSKGWCVSNQIGYFRALNGFNSIKPLDNLRNELDKACQQALKTHEMRKHLQLSDAAFASVLSKQARDILKNDV